MIRTKLTLIFTLLLTSILVQAKECTFEPFAQVNRSDGTVEHLPVPQWTVFDAITIQVGIGDTVQVEAVLYGQCSYGSGIVEALRNNVSISDQGNYGYWMITEPGVYFFVCPDADSGWSLAFIVDSAPMATLDIGVWLGGAFEPSSSLMRDDLRALGYIQGGISGSYGYWRGAEPTAFASNGYNSVVDWVRIELRDASDPSIVRLVDHGMLQRDGDVVSNDGVSPFTTFIEPGDYYVVVRHQKHLGVMSASPVTLGSGVTTIDFRDVSTNVHGTEATSTDHGVRILWPGSTYYGYQDDRKIQYTGLGNDRDRILVKVGGAVPTNTYTGSGAPTDVNMDGIVRYTGHGNDRDVILQTVGGSVPTAIRYEQVPY